MVRHLLVFQTPERSIIPVVEKLKVKSEEEGATAHPHDHSRSPDDDVVRKDLPMRVSLAAGFALVFLGAFLVFYNFADFSHDWPEDWWPLALVVLGVFVIYKSVMSFTGVNENDGFWSRLGREVLRTYVALQERLDHGERVCSELRHPGQIRVVHSPDYTAQQVEKRLRRFLEVGYSKHTRWLVIDGILSILGGVLMPLPGPNIFFFYPAARTFGHYLARSGARRAGQSWLEFVSDPLVGQVERGLTESTTVQAEIADLEAKYNVEKLEQLLIRLSQHESRSV